MNYKLSAAEIAAELGSDTARGLTVESAHERIHSRGRNTIRVPRVKKTFAGFFRRLFSPLNTALLLMALLQLAAGGADRGPVAAVLALCAAVNAAVGYIGLRRESSAASALKDAQSQTVRVIRGGMEQRALASLLTRGDVCLLEKGQTVPADAKIIECESLVADESVIDGDGSSVTKSAVCGLENESITALYMGTKILSGSAKVIVTDVGGDTQLGRALEALSRRAPSSALAARVSSIGTVCALSAAVMWAAALVLRLLGGYGVVSAFGNSISAALTAAPVSLSAILLVTTGFDIFSLKKRGVDVSSVSAMEAVGGSSVLCVGKRGTVTELGFGVSELRAGKGFDENELRLLAAMCTTAVFEDGRLTGDAMQVALVSDALANGLTEEDIRVKYPSEQVLDNRSSAHVMTTVHKTPHGYRIICKGGADAVLSRCSYIYDNGARLLDAPRDIAAVIGDAQSMASKALTVIGVAYKDVRDLGGDPESGLTFVGLMGLSNPVRTDSAQAVKVLNSMGVKVCIITDDNLTSATAVAAACGIGRGGVFRGPDCAGSLSRIMRNTVLADTPPAMKADIVAEINSGSDSVVTVGRGAKDVDAMSRSAASAATDVSAGVCAAAADVNVSGAGLMRLAAAVRECKRAFVNNGRIVGFLLSCNAAEMVCAVVSLIMGYSIPFSPLAVIWLNTVMAMIGAAAVWREPYHKSDGSRAKRQGRVKRRISPSFFRGIIWRGALMGGAAMLFYAISASSLAVDERRGAVFAALCAAFTLMAQSCRSDELIFKRLGKNHAAPVCLLLCILAGALAIMVPSLSRALGADSLSPSVIAAAAASGALSVAPAELIKLISGSRAKKKRDRKD